ncbi:MAG: EFR1 family ferrodoxin [Bacteroidota bacterium]
MKTNLFFFSSTGNNLSVAKDIAAKLPGTQIIPISRALNGTIDLNVDNIGLVFPVYFGGLPRIVVDFINQLDPAKIKYIFAVCTYGGLPAAALSQTEQLLQVINITLNAGLSIQMPGNYLVKYGAFSSEQQQRLFQKAKEKINTIVAAVKNQANMIEPGNRLITIIARLIYQSVYPKFSTLDRNFTVAENCTGCRTCEKVCPVRNIKMAANRPTWQNNCEHCLACIQWCPTQAIQYGTKTANRKRYHHPEVTVEEMYRESPLIP